MKLYQIFDSHITSLLSENPVYTANRPIEAVKMYMKERGIDLKIKISADIDVRFGAIPCVIDNGRIYLTRGRRTWFKTIKKEEGRW